MTMSDLLDKNLIIAPLVGKTKLEVLDELITKLVQYKKLNNKDEILQAVLERESLGSTGLTDGVAIPHAKTKAVDKLYLVIGIAPEAIDFEAIDGELSQFFFLVLAPEKEASAHIEVLASIARTTSSPSFKRLLKSARNADDVYSLFFD